MVIYNKPRISAIFRRAIIKRVNLKQKVNKKTWILTKLGQYINSYKNLLVKQSKNNHEGI